MAKAYSYLRFSTPEQMRGDSFRRQSEAARVYAAANALDLDDRSFEDLGISAYRGANVETGRLGEFQAAVAAGEIERGSYLLVESLDRLSRRSARKAVRVLEAICDAGITVVTLADGRTYDMTVLDDDPMAFMYAFMVAIRANEESATKARRLRAAWGSKRAKAADGKRLTSICPAWLRPEGEGFAIVEERANVVRRIFDMAASGIGQHTIAETLNREGVDTFGEGKRKGAFWHRSYVVKVLANSAVVGTLTPHTIEFDAAGKKRRAAADPVPGYFPPVVTEAQFMAVNGIGGQKAAAPRGRHAGASVQSMLAGLALCPLCGGSMTRLVKGNGAKPRLVCTTAKAGAGCEYRSVIQEDVERAIVAHAGPLSAVPGSDEASEAAVGAAEAAVEAVEERIGNLVNELSKRPSAAIRDALAEVEGELKVARKERDAAKARALAQSSRTVEANATAFYEAASVAEPEPGTVNLALKKIVRGVTVDHREEVLRFHFLTGAETTVPYSAKGYGFSPVDTEEAA